MKKKYLLLTLIVILSMLLTGCKREAPAQEETTTKVTEQRSDSEIAIDNEDDQGRMAAPAREEPHWSLQARDPEYVEGMAADMCLLYSAPSASAGELGALWRGHRLIVEKAVTVYDYVTGEEQSWYLIFLPESSGTNMGWLPEGAVVEYDDSVELPDNALYCLRPGATYWENGSELPYDSESQRFIVQLVGTDDTTGQLMLAAYGGNTIYVDRADDLIPYGGVIPPTWANVP